MSFIAKRTDDDTEGGSKDGYHTSDLTITQRYTHKSILRALLSLLVMVMTWSQGHSVTSKVVTLLLIVILIFIMPPFEKGGAYLLCICQSVCWSPLTLCNR